MTRALLIGNSDGIGRALTRHLLATGWTVVGVSRSALEVTDTSYVHHVANVCDPEFPERLESIAAQGPPFDLCVYCAGIGELLDLHTLRSETEVFDTNLMGAVATAQVLIPKFVARGRGHFIGLSSQADRVISAEAPSYSASKAGLSAYLLGLAEACRPKGVYVSTLRLGFVDTKMAKSKVRPFMISTQQAVARIERVIARRCAVDTYPQAMAWLLWVLNSAAWLRRWFVLQR